MKKYIITILAVLSVGLSATAQMRTSYFMQGSTYRTDLNPALAPLRGYVNLPLIGGSHFSINSNYLSLSTFIYPNPNGEGSVLFLNDAVKKDFLKRLPNNNKLSFDTSLNVLSFGAYTKNIFWQAGINVKAQSELVIPKDFFTALTNIGQGHYDLSHFHACINSYAEIFAGGAVPIFDWLKVGARVKGLIGIANIDMSANNMYIDINEEYVAAKMSGEMKYNSAFAAPVTPGQEISMGDAFKFGTFNLNNGGGFGIDLGAEATFFNDRLRASAAITDLGFISWGKNTTVNANMSAGVTYRGYDFNVQDVDLETDDFTMSVNGTSKGFSTRLNTSLNLGAEYTFLEDRISVGILSHTLFGHNATLSELTISGNFRPLSWLSASVSHTFLSHNRFGVFGFALNIHPTGFNLFLGTDFIGLKVAKGIPVPVNMSSMNLYMGMGFNFGKPHFHKGSKFYKG